MIITQSSHSLLLHLAQCLEPVRNSCSPRFLLVVKSASSDLAALAASESAVPPSRCPESAVPLCQPRSLLWQSPPSGSGTCLSRAEARGRTAALAPTLALSEWGPSPPRVGGPISDISVSLFGVSLSLCFPCTTTVTILHEPVWLLRRRARCPLCSGSASCLHMRPLAPSEKPPLESVLVAPAGTETLFLRPRASHADGSEDQAACAGGGLGAL